MEKTKYNLFLIFENMPLDGYNYKVVGIREGKDFFDYYSRKYDRLLKKHGSIEILGNAHLLGDYIILDSDYSLTDEEKEEFGIEE